MATVNQIGLGLSGSTGTGTFVGNSSPTLVTPTLGAASATSINFGGGALANYIPTTSFTPAVTIGGSSVGVTYGTQTGYYSRVGSNVFFNINIVLTSIGGLTGAVLITGLPITTGAFGTVSASMYTGNVTYAAGTPVAAIGASGTTITPALENSAATITAMTNAHVGNTSQFIITGHYLV
jgi:hypothetical protein